MSLFSILVTERLILTKLSEEFLPMLTKYANNRHIANNIVNIPSPFTELNAFMRLAYVTKGFNDQSRFCFAILLKDSNEFIGEISIHITDKSKGLSELAYWCGEPFWNNGYVTEAINLVLDFGFNQLKSEIIIASCKPENKASERVLVKNNMVKYQETPFQVNYKLTLEEYLKLKQRQ